MMEELLEYVPEGNCWILKNDNSISLMVRQRKRLNWDDRYNALEVWSRIKPGDICVDVGAYIGDTIQPMIAQGAEVIAFECQPDAFQCLTRNYPAIEKHQMPIGNGDFVQLQAGVGGNTGARGVSPSATGAYAARLEDILVKRIPKLIKIDVEGYEGKVLDGMDNLIVLTRPIIIIEVNVPAMARFGTTIEDLHRKLPGYRWVEWQHTEVQLWDYVAYPG